MAENPRSEAENEKPHEGGVPPRRVRAEDLFQGTSEVWIEHEGERYRLRITRRGKLILQK